MTDFFYPEPAGGEYSEVLVLRLREPTPADLLDIIEQFLDLGVHTWSMDGEAGCLYCGAEGPDDLIDDLEHDEHCLFLRAAGLFPEMDAE